MLPQAAAIGNPIPGTPIATHPGLNTIEPNCGRCAVREHGRLISGVEKRPVRYQESAKRLLMSGIGTMPTGGFGNGAPA